MNGINLIDTQAQVIAAQAAAAQAAPAGDPAEWLIDLGPFFDRFGPEVGPALDLSPNPVVRAGMASFSRRKYIDLRDERLRPELVKLVGEDVHPLLTEEFVDEILARPVAENENYALRKAYFS